MLNTFKQIDRYQLVVLLGATVLYLWVAIQSHGYYQADEQYQIIEFAGVKLGTHSSEELAWEYEDKLRSAIQPTIAYGVIHLLKTLGIFNPYHQALALRLLTAFLALFSIRYFVLRTGHTLPKSLSINSYLAIGLFLWFIPFLSVRFSSETWGGLLFVIGLGTYFSEKQIPYQAFYTGALFGLSFLFRFQMAFALLGFGLFTLITQQKSGFNYLLKVIPGFLVIVLIGIGIDTWFYSEFTLSILNYIGTFLEFKGSGFGESPWYYYLTNVISYTSFLIGTLLIVCLGIVLVRSPKNIVAWSVIAFIVIHSLVPHKEIRFLFPMAFLAPYILLLGYAELNRFKLPKLLSYIVIMLLFVVNLLGLVVINSKAAGVGRTSITKYIHEHFKGEPINLITCSWANPYDPWHGIPTKFYEQPTISYQKIDGLCELNDSLLVNDKVNLLVARNTNLTDDYCNQQAEQYGFYPVHQSFPDWIRAISPLYTEFRIDEGYVLYQLKPH